MCVDPFAFRVDEFSGYDVDDFVVDAFELGVALFFADLEFSLVEDFEDYVVDGGFGPESFC